METYTGARAAATDFPTVLITVGAGSVTVKQGMLGSCLWDRPSLRHWRIRPRSPPPSRASSPIRCDGGCDCTSLGCTVSSTPLSANGRRSGRRPDLPPRITMWRAPSGPPRPTRQRLPARESLKDMTTPVPGLAEESGIPTLARREVSHATGVV